VNQAAPRSYKAIYNNSILHWLWMCKVYLTLIIIVITLKPMNKHTKHLESTNEIKRRKTNLRDGLAVVAIMLVALLMGAAPQTDPGNPAVRDLVWAALAYVGVLALLSVTYLGYRRADERQQLVQLKAAAITFLAVVLGIFTAEMLYALKHINLNATMQILFIGSIVLWTVLQKLIESRNR
jgi:phosphatidylserine synthase